ncbi:MAG: outer membrane beta-barrel protein [Opitutales bacterium]|nr:outer membrane beta-barrel protein [Opitutales bacterium]
MSWNNWITKGWRKTTPVFIIGLAFAVSISDTHSAQTTQPEPNQADAGEDENGGSESPRERGRVLQKRNPIASEYQELGVIGQVFGASEDSEGSDFGGFFPTGILPLDIDAHHRIEAFASYQNYRRRILPGVAVRMFTPLPTDRPAGLEVDARITDSDRYIDQVRSAWASTGHTQTGLDEWILERPRFSRDRIRTRVRSTRLRGEHAVSPLHTVFAHLLAGDYRDLQSRNRFELNFRSATPEQPAEGVPGLDLTYSAAQTDSGTVRRNFRETNNFRTTLRTMVGGRHTAPTWTLDYSAYLSRWINRPVINEWNFVDRDMQISYLNQDPDFPSISIEPNSRIVESRETELSNYRIRDTRTADDDLAGRIDANIDLFGSDNWSFKTGFLYREKTRVNRSQRDVYEANPENILMLASVMNPELSSPVVKALYDLPPWIDVPSATDLINDPADPYLRNDALSSIETNEQRYQSFESVSALYTAIAYRSSKFDTEIGIRPEATRTRTSGTVIVPESFADPEAAFIDEVNLNGEQLIIQERSAQNRYSDWMGSISLAYRPAPLWQFRTAVFNNIMRPQYFDIVEYRRVNLPRREISEGNPSLTPTYIRSFSLSVERRDLPIGDIGIELNRIEIDDFFYSAEQIETIDGLDFTRSRIENGEKGLISGIQLQWQLDIPPLFGTLDTTLSSAYTYSKSEATVATRPTENLPVPERSRHLFLTGLRVRHGGLTGSVELSYQSSALDSLGESASYDIYRGNVRRLNSALSYQFEDYTFSVSASNMLNHPERAYIGEPNRVIRNLFTSQVIRFSVASQW